MEQVETLGPDERSAEEQWNEAFNKVFADLRAKHPADEWTLRLVVKEAPVVEAAAAISPEEELMVLEQLGVTNVTENEGVAAATETAELTHFRGIPTLIVEPETVTREFSPQVDGETEETEIVTATETNELTHLRGKPKLIVNPETETITLSYEPQTDEVPNGTESEGAAEVETDEVMHLRGRPKEIVEPEIITLDLPPQAEGETGVNEGATATEAPELSHFRGEARELVTPEIITLNYTPLDEEKALEADAGSAESPGAVADSEIQDNENVVKEPVAKESEEVADAVKQAEASEGAEIVNGQDEAPQADKDSSAEQPEAKDDEDFVKVEAEFLSESVAESSNQKAADQQDSAAAPEASEPAAVEAEARVELTADLSSGVSVQVEAPGLGAFNHDGSPVVEAEPPKPVEEVKTEQPQQSAVDGKTDAETPAKKPRPATPGGRKRPNSPPPQQPGDSSGRKPEWMRRPLVRKGSVGRFLGRMKETMQSKRFGPDRLPATVPPPEPEPPKRPPRRKTLANLDLNRESVTTSRDQSQVDGNSSPPSPPPPTPRSPPPNDNSVENRSVSNKSATLRSTTSERKRRNSVGRLAETAASRIRRALSIKNLNSADGSQPATAAETAPLLQQEDPSTVKPTTPVPVQQPPPSPAPEKSIKKDLVHLMHRMDPRHVFDRILTPKPPVTEEVKTKPALPERPPPPSAAVVKDRRVKPIVKNGKVQFECQKCQHRWSSVKGTARFEILINQVGDGIRHGQVLVRLFGQRCKNCPADEFETAKWSITSIEKVLTGLKTELGRRFYPEDIEPKSHQRQLCQACQEGVCHKKMSR